MGWSIGYDRNWDRDVGYGVPAICDHEECVEKIDRGLGHVCGADVYGGEYGCGLFFCSDHLDYYTLTFEADEIEVESPRLCERCGNQIEPFAPKPDSAEWIKHKLTDDSWAVWRAENPEFVKKYSDAA